MSHNQSIVILDFGSQYSQLIARKVRELEVYCELLPFDTPIEKINALNPVGFILSGGPASVYETGAPQLPTHILESGKPVLGICYGMQLLTHAMGGTVAPSEKREYGLAHLQLSEKDNPLFGRLSETNTDVWMSHGDKVTRLAPGFESIATSENSPHAAIAHTENPLFGLQFHPEVAHTVKGKSLLQAFVRDICGHSGGWTAGNFITESTTAIRKQVGDGQVLLGLSGGVDSAVAAALLHKAIGPQLTAVFVNTGLLRQNEATQVIDTFQRQMNLKLVAVDATDDFLNVLSGVTEPEQKRKIIGEKFIRIFEAEAKKLGTIDFLAQGTLYPDVIESAESGKSAAKIKTHHNVGGLPDDMQFKLVEPLRILFKDEVRTVGEKLGLPKEIVWRHPFPGPGLAVRILGEITPERLDALRIADDIFINALWDFDWYHKTSQAFAVFLPVQSVGVMGDQRTYGNVIALRAVTTDDFMTADWANLPTELLKKVSNQIVNQIPSVTRVVYDISSKPPATIEWE